MDVEELPQATLSSAASAIKKSDPCGARTTSDSTWNKALPRKVLQIPLHPAFEAAIAGLRVHFPELSDQDLIDGLVAHLDAQAALTTVESTTLLANQQ